CASSISRCAPKASTSCSSAPRSSDDPGSPLPRLGAVDRTGHRPRHRPRMGRERTVETGVLGSRSHTLETDRPLDLLPLGLAGQCRSASAEANRRPRPRAHPRRGVAMIPDLLCLASAPSTGPAIDRDTGREWVENELSKQEYSAADLTPLEQIGRWISSLWDSLVN